MSDAMRAAAIARAATPVSGAESDYDALLDAVGEARLVLIGEASHGTHEFYHERARITRRLIGEKGFCAVAVEADWPDAYRVNCFVRGAGDDASADAALGGFVRFPTWMWRNADVARFVDWLRRYNQGLPRGEPRAGFYGLDLYNLGASIDAVISYLDGVDPEAARRARARYACLEHFSADPQRYGFALYAGAAEPCEDAVVEQLLELQARAGAATGPLPDEELFAAEQNARLAASAEEYYRSMFQGRVSSWNLRDTHMADTLDALLGFLERKAGRAKVVVWAHNSHLGDARATEMGEAGELNLGQLARERYGRDVVIVGLTTYEGSVTAADGWDLPGERMRVRAGLPGSYEALLHAAAGEGGHSLMLNLRDDRAAAAALAGPLLERAIGVVYRPETERRSHYFRARLPDQFDLLIHLDGTTAVEPLAAPRARSIGELPETFPTGL